MSSPDPNRLAPAVFNEQQQIGILRMFAAFKEQQEEIARLRAAIAAQTGRSGFSGTRASQNAGEGLNEEDYKFLVESAQKLAARIISLEQQLRVANGTVDPNLVQLREDLRLAEENQKLCTDEVKQVREELRAATNPVDIADLKRDLKRAQDDNIQCAEALLAAQNAAIDPAVITNLNTELQATKESYRKCNEALALANTNMPTTPIDTSAEIQRLNSEIQRLTTELAAAKAATGTALAHTIDGRMAQYNGVVIDADAATQIQQLKADNIQLQGDKESMRQQMRRLSTVSPSTGSPSGSSPRKNVATLERQLKECQQQATKNTDLLRITLEENRTLRTTAAATASAAQPTPVDQQLVDDLAACETARQQVGQGLAAEKTAHTACSTQLDQLRTQVQNQQTTHDAAITLKDTEIAGLKTRLDQSANQVRNLSSLTVAEEDTLRNDLKKAVAASDTCAGDLRALQNIRTFAQQDNEQALKTAKIECDDKIEGLQTVIDGLRAELQAPNTTGNGQAVNDTCPEDLRLVQAEIATKQTKIDGLEARLTASMNQVRNLSSLTVDEEDKLRNDLTAAVLANGTCPENLKIAEADTTRLLHENTGLTTRLNAALNNANSNGSGTCPENLRLAQAEIASKQTEIDGLEARLTAAMNQVRNLSSLTVDEEDKLRKDLADARAANANNTSGNGSGNDTCPEDLRVVNLEILRLQGEITRLRGEAVGLETRLDASVRQVRSLSSLTVDEEDKLRKDLADAQAAIANASGSDSSTCPEELRAANARITVMEGQIRAFQDADGDEELKVELAAAKVELARLTQAIDTEQEKERRCATALRDANAQITDLETQVRDGVDQKCKDDLEIAQFEIGMLGVRLVGLQQTTDAGKAKEATCANALRDANAEIARLKTEIADLTQQLADERARANPGPTDPNNTNAEITRLQGEVDDLTQQLADADYLVHDQDEIDRLNEIIRTHQNDAPPADNAALQAAQQDLFNCQASTRTLNAQIDTLNEDKRRLQRVIDQLDLDNQDSRDYSNDCTDKLATATQALAECNTARENLTTGHTALERASADLKTEIADLKAQIQSHADCTAQLAAAKLDLTDCQAAIQSLTAERDGKENEKIKLQATIDQLTSQVKDFTDCTSDLDTAKRALGACKGTLASESRKWATEKKRLEDRILLLNNNFPQIDYPGSANTRELAICKDAFKQLTEEYEKASRALENAKLDVNEAKERVKGLETQLQNIKDDPQAADPVPLVIEQNKRIIELKKEVAELQAKITTLEAEATTAAQTHRESHHRHIDTIRQLKEQINTLETGTAKALADSEAALDQWKTHTKDMENWGDGRDADCKAAQQLNATYEAEKTANAAEIERLKRVIAKLQADLVTARQNASSIPRGATTGGRGRGRGTTSAPNNGGPSGSGSGSGSAPGPVETPAEATKKRKHIEEQDLIIRTTRRNLINSMNEERSLNASLIKLYEEHQILKTDLAAAKDEIRKKSKGKEPATASGSGTTSKGNGTATASGSGTKSKRKGKAPAT